MSNDAHPFGEAVDILDQPVHVLGLSTRPHHNLTRTAGWNGHPVAPEAATVRELVAKSGVELMRVPGLGKGSLGEIRKALAAHGLYLRGEEPLPPKPREPPPVFSPLTLSHRLQVIEAKLDLILSKLVPP